MHRSSMIFCFICPPPNSLCCEADLPTYIVLGLYSSWCKTLHFLHALNMHAVFVFVCRWSSRMWIILCCHIIPSCTCHVASHVWIGVLVQGDSDVIHTDFVFQPGYVTAWGDDVFHTVSFMLLACLHELPVVDDTFIVEFAHVVGPG